MKFYNRRSGTHIEHCTIKPVNSRSSHHSTQADNSRWQPQVRNLYRTLGFIVTVKYSRLQCPGCEKECTQNCCGEHTGGYNEQ